MYCYKAAALDCSKLCVLRKTTLSGVKKANNKMKMQYQSNLFHIWPGRPYKVFVLVVTTLVTNEIKSSQSCGKQGYLRARNSNLTTFFLNFNVLRSMSFKYSSGNKMYIENKEDLVSS